jgi:predicted DNA-binding transcriptional regulator AlpA
MLEEILEQTGLKEATFYRRLKEYRLSKNKKMTVKKFNFLTVISCMIAVQLSGFMRF